VRHYLPGYRKALLRATPAPLETNNSYLVSNFKNWTRLFWRSLEKKPEVLLRTTQVPLETNNSYLVSNFKNWTRLFWRSFEKKPEVPGGVQRRGVKTVDLEGKSVPKFSRQRSQSFSGAASSNSTPNYSHFGNFRQAARNLFVNSVLKRVTTNNAKNLRRKTAQEFLTGNSAPFLALVGVSLASGSGILTKEDEIECVCKEVRNAARKVSKLDSNEENLGNFGNQHWSLNDFNIGPVISKGCSAVVYAAKCLKNGFENIGNDSEGTEYPLAMKMMFNFHAESNAQAILKSMQKETIVAQDIVDLPKSSDIKVTPHPNIVKMYTAFSDYIPSLSESMELYPHALPPRINPQGFGRNMSLFIIMKNYKYNLRTFLDLEKNQNLPWRTSLIILTQILEGLVHLSRFKVAHRDLKTDNILMSECGSEVVITDFGCCWANSKFGFSCPYTTEDVDKGGNAALMAPEVANATPGLFSFIDYSKADVWATGTLAYEIFGFENPFYHGLDCRLYRPEELPSLSEKVPIVINNLVKFMLEKNPLNRPNADEAALISQVLLWAPKAWTSGQVTPSSQDILQWTMTMTTKVIYECNFNNSLTARSEYQLVLTFLSRVTIEKIKNTLSWICQQQ